MPTTLMVAYYIGLLVTNALVILACLIAVPNVWVRRVGVSFLWGNGLLLLFAAFFLAAYAIGTGLRDVAALAFVTFAAITAPVAIEFLVLLAVFFFKLRKWTFPSPTENKF